MTLIIAVGNPQRGDDGAASELCRNLAAGDWRALETAELTPEIAERMAEADRVVIADADYRGGQPSLQPLPRADSCFTPLSHSLRPADLVAVARRLFGFRGEAWILRIPGEDFGLGRPLSESARDNVARAARLLDRFLIAEQSESIGWHGCKGDGQSVLGGDL